MNIVVVSLVMLLGGLAFFLYGMNIMSTGLERMAGGKLETILKKASSNKVKGMPGLVILRIRTDSRDLMPQPS